jgi:ammonia channel protein AmtB
MILCIISDILLTFFYLLRLVHVFKLRLVFVQLWKTFLYIILEIVFWSNNFRNSYDKVKLLLRQKKKVKMLLW